MSLNTPSRFADIRNILAVAAVIGCTGAQRLPEEVQDVLNDAQSACREVRERAIKENGNPNARLTSKDDLKRDVTEGCYCVGHSCDYSRTATRMSTCDTGRTNAWGYHTETVPCELEDTKSGSISVTEDEDGTRIEAYFRTVPESYGRRVRGYAVENSSTATIEGRGLFSAGRCDMKIRKLDENISPDTKTIPWDDMNACRSFEGRALTALEVLNAQGQPE